MPLQLQELESLNLNDQLRLVHQRCHEHDLLPREIGLDEFSRIFSVWSGFYKAAMEYRPSLLSTLLHLFRAGEDSLRVSDQPALGWDSLAESIEVHWVPGRHEDMDQEPHVIQLAQAWQKANDAPGLVPATGSLKGTSGF
jgi:thioesterase domain-containing protein